MIPFEQQEGSLSSEQSLKMNNNREIKALTPSSVISSRDSSKTRINLNSKTLENLLQIQNVISRKLNEFYTYQKETLSKKVNQSEQNLQKIFQHFISLVSHSFAPLQAILRFLTDDDILCFGSTCKLAYKLLYSPFGYRLTMNLRPPIYKIDKGRQGAKDRVFSESALRNLSEDPNLENLEEDDKMAVMVTMKTNLIATKHKIKELNGEISRHEKQAENHIATLTRVNLKRQGYEEKIENYKNEIEKISEIIKEGDENMIKLKEEHEKIIFGQQNDLMLIQNQRQKLKRQKELLINKLKSLEEERKGKEKVKDDAARLTSLIRKLTSS